MKVAILLFPGVTALDAIGPYEVLARVPGAEITFVAAQAGPQETDTGRTSIMAETPMEQYQGARVLLVPGGPGSREAMEDEATIEWLRSISASTDWTTSVCTGSLVLAAAGLLEGRRATTHWLYLERLRELGCLPIKERVVTDGKFITAAGVSAGIDMALTLVAQATGPELAEAIQLGIEYDPQPPFNSGSPGSAPPETVELVTALAARSDRWLEERLSGN